MISVCKAIHEKMKADTHRIQEEEQGFDVKGGENRYRITGRSKRFLQGCRIKTNPKTRRWQTPYKRFFGSIPRTDDELFKRGEGYIHTEPVSILEK